MPTGRVNNIQPPREGQRDHLVWICPDDATEQQRDRHVKYYCRDPQSAGLQRGVRVEYDAPGDNRVTRRVRVLAAAPGMEGRHPPLAPAGHAAAHRPPAAAPDRPADRGVGAAGGGGRQPPQAPAGHAAAPHPASTEDRLCIPLDAARIVEPRLSDPRALHPGLLLDRLPTQKHISKQEHQKEHLERVVRARPWSKEEYEDILKHLEGDGCDFVVTAKSRIALHLSRAGGLENANCCLHPVYGFAYLPGSGLKGLAAAYAGHVYHVYETTGWPTQEGEKDSKEAREHFIREVEDIFGWAPNKVRTQCDSRPADPRSARAKARDFEQQRGAVVFHDAFGIAADGTPPQLEIDVLTCHYPGYYQANDPPGDWQSPRPVTFLTIAAGTKFRFRVRPADSRTRPELVEAAKRLLLGGLYWLGAGAKTAAGYGWFDSVCQFYVTPKQIVDSLKPGEFLWVRDTGPRQGYRVAYVDDKLQKTDEKIELACQFNQPTEKGSLLVVAPNPNPDSKKPIPLRLIKDFKLEMP